MTLYNVMKRQLREEQQKSNELKINLRDRENKIAIMNSELGKLKYDSQNSATPSEDLAQAWETIEHLELIVRVLEAELDKERQRNEDSAQYTDPACISAEDKDIQTDQYTTLSGSYQASMNNLEPAKNFFGFTHDVSR